MGSGYLRGKTWWIQYYRIGKPCRESAETKKKTVAKELLKQIEGDVLDGKTPRTGFYNVFFEDLVEILRTDYELKKRKSEPPLKHLTEFFSSKRVFSITTDEIKKYIIQRKEWIRKKCNKTFDAQDKCPHCGSDKLIAGAKNGTINRELAALKKMLRLGPNETPPKVDRVPHIPMLKEADPRQGFLESDEYLEFFKALPSYLRSPVIFRIGPDGGRVRYPALQGSGWTSRKGPLNFIPALQKMMMQEPSFLMTSFYPY